VPCGSCYTSTTSVFHALSLIALTRLRSAEHSWADTLDSRLANMSDFTMYMELAKLDERENAVIREWQMNSSVMQTEPSYSPCYDYDYGYESMDGLSYCDPGRDADDFHWLGHREGEAVPKWQRGRSSSF
jgi:hypothetical protein